VGNGSPMAGASVNVAVPLAVRRWPNPSQSSAIVTPGPFAATTTEVSSRSSPVPTTSIQSA
jgi:hypothetical protein